MTLAIILTVSVIIGAFLLLTKAGAKWDEKIEKFLNKK
jgi:hypothetical protein